MPLKDFIRESPINLSGRERTIVVVYQQYKLVEVILDGLERDSVFLIRRREPCQTEWVKAEEVVYTSKAAAFVGFGRFIETMEGLADDE